MFTPSFTGYSDLVTPSLASGGGCLVAVADPAGLASLVGFHSDFETADNLSGNKNNPLRRIDVSFLRSFVPTHSPTKKKK